MVNLNYIGWQLMHNFPDKQTLAALGFKPITHQCENLFHFFFRKYKEEFCYASAWLYLTQAARGCGGLGYYYKIDESFVFALGYHDPHFVIIHPLGEFPPSFFQLAEQLCNLSGKPVFVKKISFGKQSKLRKLARNTKIEVTTTRDYPWTANEPSDDDTFPEIIIDVPQFLELVDPAISSAKTGKQIRNIRNRSKHFQKNELKIDFVSSSCCVTSEIIRMLNVHFNKDERQVASYLNMIEILTRNPETPEYIHFVAKYENQPIGFFVAEKLTPTSAGLYASISLREFAGQKLTGLSEYLHLKLFQKLREQGIRHLNLGGAVQEDLYKYKRKFIGDGSCLVGERSLPILVLKTNK